MFEKEAEEWEKEITDNADVEIHFGKPMKVMPTRKQSFQKGAEFGYNKANEWHYVKDKLPPENIPLNIITFDKNKKRRLWEGEYKGLNGKCWTGYFNPYIDIPYAWKEIVLPELPGGIKNV